MAGWCSRCWSRWRSAEAAALLVIAAAALLLSMVVSAAQQEGESYRRGYRAGVEAIASAEPLRWRQCWSRGRAVSCVRIENRLVIVE